MKKIVLALVALCIAFAVHASQPGVKVTAMAQEDNSLAFFADINGYGTISVALQLFSTDNIADEENLPRSYTITERSGEFARLYPADTLRPVTASFDYSWIQGRLDPKTDTDFAYRLPFEVGITTTPKKLSNYDVGLFRGNFRNFIAWQFPLRKGDDVFAARKGEVIRIEGFFPTGNEEEAMMASISNTIYIEHSDGSIAMYNMLDSNSLLVKEGDTVLPNTQLAKTGAIDRETYGVRLTMYYFVTNRSAMYPEMISQTIYFDPTFATASDGDIKLNEENNITSTSSKQLVNKEKSSKNFWQKLLWWK